jgi:hypothetical protein
MCCQPERRRACENRPFEANRVQFRPKSSNRISRPARSTALPPLRDTCKYYIIASGFLEIPLIEDLLCARSLALEKIAETGGAKDCYEKWIQVNGKTQPRDILARVAQCWEMKLVYPAFEITDKTEDFKIMLFQHDGSQSFSVPMKRRGAGRLRRLLIATLKSLGYLRRSNGLKRNDRPNDRKNQIRYGL